MRCWTPEKSRLPSSVSSLAEVPRARQHVRLDALRQLGELPVEPVPASDLEGDPRDLPRALRHRERPVDAADLQRRTPGSPELHRRGPGAPS